MSELYQKEIIFNSGCLYLFRFGGLGSSYKLKMLSLGISSNFILVVYQIFMKFAVLDYIMV